MVFVINRATRRTAATRAARASSGRDARSNSVEPRMAIISRGKGIAVYPGSKMRRWMESDGSLLYYSIEVDDDLQFLVLRHASSKREGYKLRLNVDDRADHIHFPLEGSRFGVLSASVRETGCESPIHVAPGVYKVTIPSLIRAALAENLGPQIRVVEP
jgi:hypothetical protein